MGKCTVLKIFSQNNHSSDKKYTCFRKNKEQYKLSKSRIRDILNLVASCFSPHRPSDFLAFSTSLGFWSHPTVDQPAVDNGRIRREQSLAVAIMVSYK